MIFKKCDKMPVTMVLLACSWLVALAGLVSAIYSVTFGAYRVESILTAFLILLGGVVTAAVIRMIANIGQFLFEIRGQCFRMNEEACEIKTDIQEIRVHVRDINVQTKDINVQTKDVNAQSKDINTNVQELKALAEKFGIQVEIIKTQLSEKKDLEQKRDSLLEQIGCDSKDLAQNINQIKTFFEQIERHLDLKK